MRTAKFLVVLIVLKTNMAIRITPELKRWINIAILRHMSFPVGKTSDESQKTMFESCYTIHDRFFLATLINKQVKLS